MLFVRSLEFRNQIVQIIKMEMSAGYYMQFLFVIIMCHNSK